MTVLLPALALSVQSLAFALPPSSLTTCFLSVKETYLGGKWMLTEASCKVWSGHSWQQVSEGTSFKAETGKKYLCVFVNDKKGEIEGFKFSDDNGNGKWNFGEEGLAGWEITLEKWVCEKQPPVIYDQRNDVSTLLFNNDRPHTSDNKKCSWQEDSSTITGEHGKYSFESLEYGKYRVCEVQQPGYTQTYPTKYGGCHIVEVSRHQRKHSLKFGNKPHRMELDVVPMCNENFPYATISATLNFQPADGEAFTVEWLTAAGVPAGGIGSILSIPVSEFAVTNNGNGTHTYTKTILWLGASTLLPDWPGYSFTNGLWAADPGDVGGNTRPEAQIRVSINPTNTTSLSYPGTADDCFDPSNPQVLGTNTLSNTGSSALISIIASLSLICAAAYVLLGHRATEK